MAADRQDIDWQDGIPVSRRYGDAYFSREGGLAETRHVFLAGNGLPERFRDGFRIAELGFGTGLNFLATLLAWRASGAEGRLHYTSFEAFPLSADDTETALSAFPEALAAAGPLLTALKRGETRLESQGAVLDIILGDARQTLPGWRSQADAWYLDGFTPAKNPELWEAPLLAELARRTAPLGTFATYSAAGAARRALAEAGFAVSRSKGYGRKRHMTTGILPG
jgi:tRNA U34 5-methylaminomethyl-2-thiouridine-forming methyltransferase MnmC